MRFVLRLFTLFALSLPIVLPAQQEKPLGAELRVHWDGFVIFVIKDDVRHPLSVEKEAMAAAIDSVKLLSAKASGDFMYLLFDLTGPSRGQEEANSQCGAGVERSLIWVKLNTVWQKVDSQNFVIESCWDTAYLKDEGAPITFSGPDLVARGRTYRDPKTENTSTNYRERRYEVSYSLKHPESGLKINLITP